MKAAFVTAAVVVLLLGLSTARGAEESQGESVAKASMEAQAAEMLAEEEKSENMLRSEAAAEHPDLGESALPDDDDPAPPWEADAKRKKIEEEQSRDEMRIKADMDEFDGKAPKEVTESPPMVEEQHEDLGESSDVNSHHGDLGESAQVESKATESDANTLTSRAQAEAHAQTRMHQKQAAIHRAKAIADKVKSLVQQQQHLEDESGQKVPGSILGKAREDADKAADMSARDELLAHKLEDEQAQSTMQHLIETERMQQRKAFEEERESTHSLLKSVREKLNREQHKMVNQVRTETTEAVLNVEKKLTTTNLAQTIEDVVKKKLAKRLDELRNVGQQTVHDVAAQMGALKRRVTRLRRDQERMKRAEERSESTMEQRMMATHSERDLGESASVGESPSAKLLETMQLQQMMRNQMMPMQQPMQQSPMQMEEHMELMKMKEEMAQMRKQNEMLQQLAMHQVSMREAQATKPTYTHSGLQKYFNRRHEDVAALKQSVQAERQRLEALTSKLSEAEADPDGAAESGPALPALAPQMLLELAEGADEPETATALPLYNQLAEQARVDSEDLRQKAFEENLASQYFGE